MALWEVTIQLDDGQEVEVEIEAETEELAYAKSLPVGATAVKISD